MKKYKVVQPPVIDSDDPMGLQEPIADTDVRDLVNVEDESDRFMANPDDFDSVDEIVTENEFTFKRVNVVDEQGVYSADMAFRKEN